MYINTLLIYLINTVVHYCNHYVPLHERDVESYTESHSSRPAEVVEMGGRNRQLTVYWEPWQGMKG